MAICGFGTNIEIDPDRDILYFELFDDVGAGNIIRLAIQPDVATDYHRLCSAIEERVLAHLRTVRSRYVDHTILLPAWQRSLPSIQRAISALKAIKARESR